MRGNQVEARAGSRPGPLAVEVCGASRRGRTHREARRRDMGRMARREGKALAGAEGARRARRGFLFREPVVRTPAMSVFSSSSHIMTRASAHLGRRGLGPRSGPVCICLFTKILARTAHARGHSHLTRLSILSCEVSSFRSSFLVAIVLTPARADLTDIALRLAE